MTPTSLDILKFLENVDVIDVTDPLCAESHLPLCSQELVSLKMPPSPFPPSSPEMLKRFDAYTKLPGRFTPMVAPPPLPPLDIVWVHWVVLDFEYCRSLVRLSADRRELRVSDCTVVS